MKLRAGEPSALSDLPAMIEPGFYIARSFNVSSVATKAFILQLAAHHPKSFKSGQPIPLDTVLAEPNRREYHHCFPKAYLLRESTDLHGAKIDSLVNYAFLSRAENREISDKAPSEYRTLMPKNVDTILTSQILPSALFDDDWEEFMAERSADLLLDAEDLMLTGLK